MQELYRYVSTELLEVPPAEMQAFMDEFNHQIFNLASSADVNDKKGAILATGGWNLGPTDGPIPGHGMRKCGALHWSLRG